MREKKSSGAAVIERAEDARQLSVFVPFTTPQLTRAALRAVDGMGTGLNVSVRLINVHVVPYPLNLDEPAVYLDFLRDQLAQFQSNLPITSEIRLARDLAFGLSAAIPSDAVVVLAARKRPWKTRTERLADYLRRDGHRVVLVR